MDTKIITISSGRGPAECCWVVAQVLKQLLETIRENGMSYTLIDEVRGDQPGTYQSVSVAVKGGKVFEKLSDWEGTIQWIGTSMFRKHHKRKNWFVSVALRDEEALTKVELKQLKFQTMRSGGKGGQNVNKVNTAVRITHIPSGISVTSSEQRSQLQNKKVAIQKLQLKLEEAKLKELGEVASQQWEDKIQVERGNPVKVFTSIRFKETKGKQLKSFSPKRQKLKLNLKKELNELNK